MKTKEDSDIERRLLLAILLSMAVLFTAPYLLRYFNPTPPSPPIQESTVQTEPEPMEAPESVAREQAEIEAEESPADAVPATATEAEPRDILVENGSMELRFTNVGASLASVRLKNILADDGENLELIPQDGLTTRRPLSIYVDSSRRPDLLATAVFEVSVASTGLIRAPTTIQFEYRNGEFDVVRRIHIPDQGYLLEVETEVRDRSRSIPFEVALGAGIGNPPDGTSSDFRKPAVAFPEAGSIERFDLGDLEEPVPKPISGWAAIDSKYFALVLFQPEAVRNLLMDTVLWTQTQPDAETVETGLVSGRVELAAGSSFTFFVGPKKKEELAALDPTLVELINYGWFGPIVRPLLAALNWINGSVENYGWSIIILTFVINLALFPIRYKQMASMQKMSALQPKLKSIQDKYKRMKRDDPRKQQMNTEVMALYKQHGVNPLGGCLPLLLQMPILFAFFRMLDASIELRGAPFILWIHDLSKADPYYVTPIVMGISMVVQQRMTPATGDPTQRKMMMFLPVVFTFLFLSFSSGLVIYFLFSNLFAMMLQLGLQKLKPELAPKKAAGSRAAKSKK